MTTRAATNARPLCGGSDVDAYAPVVSLVKDAPLCGDCIARTVGLLRWEVDGAITGLRRAMPLVTEIGPCARCCKQAVVHRLR